MSEDELLEAFQAFDEREVGFFSAKELSEICRTRLQIIITKEEVDEMIRVADIDCDGRINFEEFVRIML